MKKKLTIAFAIITLITGCNQSKDNNDKDKLSNSVDLDSAISDLTNIQFEIYNEIENGLTSRKDFVVFTERKDISQENPIYFKDELLNSKIVRYFQNKKLKYEAKCINGWIEGTAKTYDSLGNLISKHIYKAGKLNGVCEVYFPNKKLARSITCIEGKESGIQKAYHENGNIAFEGQMVNGEKYGEHIYYYSSGNKSAVLNYSFGIRRHSFWRDSTEMGYRAHGDFFEYFENGSIKYQAKYVNGLPEGLVFANYSKGKEYVENWHKGHIVGKTERYYENGQLESIGTFNENGEEIGEWREFYDNGKLRLNIKFDKGKIVEQHYYNYDKESSTNVDDLRTIFPGAENRY